MWELQCLAQSVDYFEVNLWLALYGVCIEAKQVIIKNKIKCCKNTNHGVGLLGPRLTSSHWWLDISHVLNETIHTRLSLCFTSFFVLGGKSCWFLTDSLVLLKAWTDEAFPPAASRGNVHAPLLLWCWIVLIFCFYLMVFIPHQVLQGHMTPTAFTHFTCNRFFSFFPFNLWWMTMFLKCNQRLTMLKVQLKARLAPLEARSGPRTEGRIT